MGERVDFGKHQGERWTRVPVGYLRWMISAEHEQADTAEAELNRRGTALVDEGAEITGHAIDRMSQRHLHVWSAERVGDEGLHHFLKRVTLEALEVNLLIKGKYHYMGMKLVINTDMAEPSLRSVM